MKIKQLIPHFNAWIIKQFKFDPNSNMVDNQRFYAYVYTSIGLIIGISLNLFGVMGPQELFFKYANCSHLVLNVILLLLVAYRKLTIYKALTALIIVSQLEISAEMIYSAYSADLYHLALIIGNTVLLSILLMLSVLAYIRHVPMIVSFISMTTYGVCVAITQNDIILNFFIVFAFAYLVLTLMSNRFIKQSNKLQGENAGLRRRDNEMLFLFNMDEVQMQAYLNLIHKKGKSKTEVEHLMEQIGGETRKNLRYNITLLIEQETINYTQMEELLPMLTVSEREICRLVLEGKKLSEVSRILGKSETNISCQRSNIRTKLDLKQGDDLRKRLLEMTQK